MYKEKIYENKNIVILVLFIIYVSSYGYSTVFINSYKDYNFNICKIDLVLLILTQGYIGTFLSIFPAYLSMHMTKYDFNTNLILRYKNKKIIWLKQNLHIIMNSFIIMCSVAVFNLIIGGIKQKVTYNWDSKDSLFFRITKGMLIKDKQVIVIVSTIIIGTLIISIVSILCNLIYWITNSQIISMLIVISFCLFNVFKQRFYFNIFTKAKLKEIDFITGNKIVPDIIILSCIIISLIFLSIIIIRKKEFLNDARR